MNCPNCDYEIGNLAVCPNCNIDPVLFINTGNISNRLYNKGLQQVNNQDIGGAIESLNKSLEFNKNNYVARNLLGLIYYEVGRIGEALRHWIISASIMKTNNPAKDYIDELQESARTLERYADAVNMYNQALEYVIQKSDDMAIIQLKKAIDLSPKFIEAMNLLTFCYLIQKDKSNSITMIERVLAIDANNQIALRYYNEVNPSSRLPAATRPRRQASPNVVLESQPSYSHLNPKDKKSFGEYFPFAEIISFVVGCICMAAVFYVLVMPSRMDSVTQALDAEKSQRTAAEQTYLQQVTEKDNTIEEQDSKIKSLTSENQTLNAQLTLQQKLQDLERVQSLSSSDPEEAADLIYAMDPSGLPSDTLAQYGELKDELYPKVAQSYYNSGIQSYNASNYDEAKNYLEKSLLFAEEDASFMGNLYYYLGRVAEANSDIISAKNYYNKVIEEYPNSNNARTAQTRLNALE